MNSNVGIVPFFKRGDIGGLTYLVTNNIVNYLIVIATLSGVLKWPDKVVFGYVIPGMSIGLFLGCYYAWMGYRISKRDQRPDVTALPSGVSTTAMFVMLYCVIMPLSYAVEDPMVAWSAAMAACFLGGAVFCLFCDLIARTVFSPTELSISSVTAVFGAPVVLYVMINRKRG